MLPIASNPQKEDKLTRVANTVPPHSMDTVLKESYMENLKTTYLGAILQIHSSWHSRFRLPSAALLTRGKSALIILEKIQIPAIHYPLLFRCVRNLYSDINSL